MTLDHSALRLALGGLLSLAVAMGIGRFAYTPLLPEMVAEIPLSNTAAGLLASSNFLGYLLGALAASLPAFSQQRRVLLWALASSGITTALTGASSEIWFLLAVRFAGGVASAFVFVFASSIVLARLGEMGRPGLTAVHFAGVGTGIAASAAFLAALSAVDFGWRGAWLMLGVVSLAALPAVAQLVAAAPSGDRRTSGPTASLDLTRPLVALIVAYGLFGFGYVITATFLVAIVRATAEMQAWEQTIWILFGLAAIPSVALWSRLAMRAGVFRIMALACIVEAVGVAASVLVPSLAGAILASLFLGGTFVGITALGLVGARSLSNSDPARVTALMTGSFGAGQIVGPAFAGFVVERTGNYVTPTLAAALMLLVAAALSFGITRVRPAP
jgi:predicted MFS family arabinose efflux permease